MASANVAESPAPVLTVGDVPDATVPSAITKEECSCIKTARNLGVKIPFGTNAKDLVPNSPPIIGGLILLKYGVHHVVVLEGFEGGFQVAEGNFEKGPCVVTRRRIDFNDPHIIGFWDSKGGQTFYGAP